MKHKALKQEGYKKGVTEIKGNGWMDLHMVKNPLAFANSDNLRKIKNRNKRRKQ